MKLPSKKSIRKMAVDASGRSGTWAPQRQVSLSSNDESGEAKRRSQRNSSSYGWGQRSPRYQAPSTLLQSRCKGKPRRARSCVRDLTAALGRRIFEPIERKTIPGR